MGPLMFCGLFSSGVYGWCMIPDLAQFLISSRSYGGTEIVKGDKFPVDKTGVAHLKRWEYTETLFRTP